MGYIFCLMGKSSSGKDTVYQRLMMQEELALKNVIPYTTRPIREGEIQGESYFFCNEEEVEELERKNKIIELRAYNTIHGIWKYFTADDGQIDLSSGNYLLIGTLETFQKLRSCFGTEAVIPIYIEIEDGERLQRALNRERIQSSPKYEEMCRRFLADQADFSEEKIRQAGVEKRFINDDLEESLKEISSYIKGKL